MATQDFRGYVQANAPQYLGFVGNDVNGNGTTGINVGKVNQVLSSGGNKSAGSSLYGVSNLNDFAGKVNNLYGQYAASQQPSGSYVAPAASNATTNGYTPGDVAYLDDQASDINNLLGRTNTGLSQGLDKLNNDYQSNLNQTYSSHNQALQDLNEKGIADTQAKQTAYDTINQNAHNGYRSLAQVIGRGAGVGSSAFQELLPNVVGNDISTKRSTANDTYAANTAALTKTRQQDDNTFAQTLADLANQRSQGENDLRTGVEQQRQQLQSQLGNILGQKAQAQGGGYAEVKAAQAPTQAAIDQSRNTVDSFFNQFKSPVTAQYAPVATPTLDAYNVDRSTVNAAGSPDATDDTNPYASFLRKQLQGAV